MMLNNEQLQLRAQNFALTNELVIPRRTGRGFWPAFKVDMESLRSFAKRLVKARVACSQPAEDWLLDHMAFIETQAQDVLQKLSRTTLHQLPRLRNTGLPRVYAVCEDYLDHMDGRYDVLSFEKYVLSYQQVSVLKTLECWVLPSAMRVVIIRRLAEAMREVRYRNEVCDRVGSLVEHVRSTDGSDEKIRAILLQETKDSTLSPVEVVHLVQHLTEWEPDLQLVQEWLAAHIDNSKSSLEHMVSYEHQLQAQLQVICGNLVQSLHVLERFPWRQTFIKISSLERILASHTDSDYHLLDVESRDVLRNRVTEIADRLHVPETLVAETAILLAGNFRISTDEAIHATSLPPRQSCFPYYLLDAHGISTLCNQLSKLARPRLLPTIAMRKRPLSTYFSGAALLFVLGMVLSFIFVMQGGTARILSMLAVFVALVLPVSEWMVTILHIVLEKCCQRTPLLRYDFSKGLPISAITMVVMPIIWSSIDEVDDVMDRLLVHHLANRQKNIHFAVLADLPDALTEQQDSDDAIVTHALQRTKALQNKYGKDRFFLFHRKRRFNPTDRIYMGWERKRGKLVEFVDLLSGSRDTSFTTVCGETNILSQIRYVFTVDHDTQLPMGTVSRMAGTIHYPYNRPRLNKEETRVIEGFGVLQPRIGVSFESTTKSRFASLWAGEPGIDPYAFAVSNPYQDLFGKAVFVGKGIFDVDAFRKTLSNRIPDNRVLSHDILEGGFLRAGLTSDIEVVEDHPGSFYAYQLRAHRWIRGDWQLIRWLMRTCRNRQGDVQKIDVCGLTRWHIVDNLRKSLIAPSLLMVMLLGLGILPGRPGAWETVVLVTIFLPFVFAVISWLQGKKPLRSVGITFLQGGFRLLTLPFASVVALDAVFRTIYRMTMSKKHLLDWMPAAKTDNGSKKRRVFVYEPLGYALVAVFVFLSWMVAGVDGRVIFVVLLILWVLAHPIVKWLNQDRQENRLRFVDAKRTELEQFARQIWAFYERYVTEQESWLPPDNVQYLPEENIAHRTSPTNIGLYLACVVAAADLKLISVYAMVLRLESALRTMSTLAKWNGHLFNWYDTVTGEPLVPRYVSTVDSGNLISYLMVVRQGLEDWGTREAALRLRIEQLMSDIENFIEQTDFYALFNPDEQVFCLGYHVEINQRENVLYDLLASESRQASFVAIALGQIPASHWFALGRTMTMQGKHKVLLSWSGTMFEYLMPNLIMRTYRNTIWDSTYRGVVTRQIQYGNFHGVPFGISESGYYAFDEQMNYQYRAFGVPGLGFDRGLERNLVVAPYATILALPFAKEVGMKALRQFEELGAKGEYGFYEAVDFTVNRLPQGDRYKIIQSFMAHHQAMSLLALTNLLTNDSVIRRFHADKRVRAADLLLQERTPVKAALIEKPIGLHAPIPDFTQQVDEAIRKFTEPTADVFVNVLSNGRMTSIGTNDGNGMLLWNGLSVIRWREDPVVDSSGAIIYLHDVDREVTFTPTDFPCHQVDDQKTVFGLDRSTYEGTYQGIYAKLEITVSGELDAEVRRLRVVNRSSEQRTLEVTSFFELALASQDTDRIHPAFSKLFIQTSHDKDAACLLAKRRPREEKENETWAVHTMYVDDKEKAKDYEFETDRAAFIGRGGSLQAPRAMTKRLRGSVGSVVDPAFVMRRCIRLVPDESVTLYMITGVATSKGEALKLISQLCEPAQADQAFHLAFVRTQIDLRHLHLTAKQIVTANELAASLLYTSPLSRIRRQAITHNRLGQSSLWRRGISGDAPIVTVRVNNVADLPFIVELAKQHHYLCTYGLAVDLIVLDETVDGYQNELMNRLYEELAVRGIHDKRRMICLKSSQLAEDELILITAVSRVLLRAGGPSLHAQLQMGEPGSARLARQISMHRASTSQVAIAPELDHLKATKASSEFFNGWGGFVDEGKAYQINVSQGNYLPKPWSNVLSNPRFGTVVTELGTGYTWWKNSRECKLTPWTNDPVLDRLGECLYLRDVETDEVWSAAPKPAGDLHTYTVTHGFGFTRIKQLAGDMTHEMEITVPVEDSLKVIRLTLRNRGSRLRRIAVTYYAEWVLGVMREDEAPYIVTEWDVKSGTLLAKNRYQETFRDAIVFLHMNAEDEGKRMSWTGDRSEFIGKGGTLACPIALLDSQLSCKVGAFYNTCGAVQTVVEVPAHAEHKITILLGCATSLQEVQSLATQYGTSKAYDETYLAVVKQWGKVAGQVQVKTPDRAMDILLNGWLLYQALGCRLLARTGFYQAGGAYGYRDQLQDALAFLHSDVTILRKQILRNAAHQYEEGDVQHWWHEETKKGIRTKYSDDLLWLPYAVSRYIVHTGDIDLLKENAPFLHSTPLSDIELERYEDTVLSKEFGTVLEHCVRAISHAAKFGEHGIPLMGIGDWNDGMNRVGAKGRGESVWLGWFLLHIVKRFSELHSDVIPANLVQEFADMACTLQVALDKAAWDGAWFRRAFTDDGAWLGSIVDKECRIDAIAQSWSVISQGTTLDRQDRAMRSFDRELVDQELGLALLLTKAFDETKPSPGYIEGYPPGIRENGGQYTHGVIWSIVAWAMLGRQDKAFALFSMLNPISHTQTAKEVLTFCNEPYVMSADVYTAEPHQGQAGWSWYTGAAGWMYQAGLEYILGVKRVEDRLLIEPCVPKEWKMFTVLYKYGEASYHIDVHCDWDGSNVIALDNANSTWNVDGKQVSQSYLPLIDDGQEHQVTVYHTRMFSMET